MAAPKIGRMVSGEEISLDWAGTGPQVPGDINVVYLALVATVYYALKALLELGAKDVALLDEIAAHTPEVHDALLRHPDDLTAFFSAVQTAGLTPLVAPHSATLPNQASSPASRSEPFSPPSM